MMSAGTQPVLIPAWTPAPAQLHMAFAVCSGITRRSAKNFYYGFLVLPKSKRQALCAVYAFMRRCDDIADDPTLTAADRRNKLDTWLDALHRAQQGHPTDDPILLALSDTQQRFTIPAGLLDELALGTAMDVQDPQHETSDAARYSSSSAAPIQLDVEYQTFDDLKLYCHRVASVVGLVCIHIFGYRDPAAEPLAEELGLAFQLTNIIRDVKEDASLRRIYLPQEDLAKFNISTAEILASDNPARFRDLLAFEADRAREYYRSGDNLIPFIQEDSQPALFVLLNVYRGLLEKIAARNYDVFTAKVSLTVTEKLRILGKGFWQRIS